MKETIYTIPINEAYERDEECPLCYLEKRLEAEALDYALGAAMMEPDYRVESNATGYCCKHFADLLKKPNKLALALVLDTHMEEIRKKTAEYETIAKDAMSGKKKLFKKSDADSGTDRIADGLGEINNGCMVCKKTNAAMERYINVLLYMWNKDDDFKQKFDASRGVCMPHFEKLCRAAKKEYSAAAASGFILMLCKKQNAELARLNDEIHRFTLKFDYRNRDMDLGEAKDSPARAVQKLGGYFDLPEQI